MDPANPFPPPGMLNSGVVPTFHSIDEVRSHEDQISASTLVERMDLAPAAPAQVLYYDIREDALRPLTQAMFNSFKREYYEARQQLKEVDQAKSIQINGTLARYQEALADKTLQLATAVHDAARFLEELNVAREALARIGRECPGKARELAWATLPRQPMPAAAVANRPPSLTPGERPEIGFGTP